jgi:hypothetical protein
MIWYGIAGFVLIMAVSFFRKTDKYEDLCAATFIFASVLLMPPMGQVEGFLRPSTVDLQLRLWDLRLGLDGFAVARLCGRYSWICAPLAVVYSGLVFVLAVNWALERSKLFLWAATIGGLLAVPCYMLIPACGPKYAFTGYPWTIGRLAEISTDPSRNCFPSMHFAWVLLLVLNARSGMWKALGLAYCFLMIFATVGGGEHYFVDLIAAVPFTLAVQSITEWLWLMRGRQRVETGTAIDGLNTGSPVETEMGTFGRVAEASKARLP